MEEFIEVCYHHRTNLKGCNWPFNCSSFVTIVAFFWHFRISFSQLQLQMSCLVSCLITSVMKMYFIHALNEFSEHHLVISDDVYATTNNCEIETHNCGFENTVKYKCCSSNITFCRGREAQKCCSYSEACWKKSRRCSEEQAGQFKAILPCFYKWGWRPCLPQPFCRGLNKHILTA